MQRYCVEIVAHSAMTVVWLLTTNLNKKKAVDKKLSTVALRKGVNEKAAS